MIATCKFTAALYVERSQPRCWIVRDPDGNFWSVPPVENPWANRRPFEVTEFTELDPVSGHYKYMLGVPF